MSKPVQSFGANNGLPANNRKNTKTAITVQNDMASVSGRVAGPSGSHSVRSCQIKNQKISVYWLSSSEIKAAFLAALLATPFTISIDMFLRESQWPMIAIISAAIKFVMIGISIRLVKKFMGLPFGGDGRCENPIINPAGGPANPAQAAIKNVAAQEP